MNKIFSIFLILSFVVATPLYAQESTDSTVLDWDQIKEEIKTKGQPVDRLQIPYLEARSIELSRGIYSPGDLIEGAVVVRNGGTISSDNVVPTISLIGNFDGHVPTELFHSQTSDQSLDLGPGETKSIAFAYRLPEVLLSDDLAIQVEFYTSTGLRQDSIYKKIEVNGEVQQTTINNSRIVTRDREYGLRTTPTVYDGDNLTLSVDVSTSVDTIMSPSIALHDFSVITGDVVKNISFDTETVSSGQSTLDYEVDTNIPMGLYEGVATFTNEDGVNVIPPVFFLFIKDGDGSPFMIRNITAKSPSDTVDHVFQVSYTSGAPDIDMFLDNPNALESDELIGSVTDEDSPLPTSDLDFSGIKVRIDVRDDRGSYITSGEVPATEAGDFIISIPVDLSDTPTGNYSVTASAVSAGGDTLSSYEKDMYIETSYVPAEPDNSPNIIIMVVILIILIILISVIMKLGKSNKNKGMGIPTVMITLLILAGGLMININEASAYVSL